MALTLALFCTAIVATSLLGGLLPLATSLTHTRLQLYLSFAAGTMLGAVFFHMLPEAVESGPSTALTWAVTGLLSIFFLERFFAFHHHEAPADSAPHSRSGAGSKASALQWQAAAFGLAIHSLAGGVALASAAPLQPADASAATAWGVFLATVVHKPADSLTIVSLMLRGGASRGLAFAVNAGFALMIPAGVLLFLSGIAWLDPTHSLRATSAALSFSAGSFLCIALSDLLPELQFHHHDRIKLSIALLSGVFLMGVLARWE